MDTQLELLSYDHPILIFDGVCNLCNVFINEIIKRDENKIMRYTTLQSDTFQQLTKGFSQPLETDSVLLIKNGNLYSESDVAIQVFYLLGYPWRILYLLRWIPKGIRNYVYRWIAKNRYRLFGKRESCMMPTEEISSLFL